MSERTALYRLFDNDDALLYVGITKHLTTRWNHHARHQQWWPEVARQTADWFETRAAAEAAEIAAIEHEHPRHNITHAVVVLTPEEAVSDARSRASLAEAEQRWLEMLQLKQEAKDAFFDLCAERVQEGLDTADTLAARSFPTAVTIRKELRARGVKPLPRGPKRDRQPAGE